MSEEKPYEYGFHGTRQDMATATLPLALQTTEGKEFMFLWGRTGQVSAEMIHPSHQLWQFDGSIPNKLLSSQTQSKPRLC